MAMRWGPGPVFVYEWLRIARRWQLYACRSAFVAILLLGLFLTWGAWSDRPEGYERNELAYLGQATYAMIVNIEMTLVLLAAPAATAGAVCLDKARGSLIQVMATDLSDSEIVLGKLGAALVPVVGLVFCVLPMMMLASLLGGIDPALLFGSFLVTLGTSVLVCTLAFTLSVWGRKTHEVLGATYLIVVGWVAFAPLFVVIVDSSGYVPYLEAPLTAAVAATNPYALMHPAYDEPTEAHLAQALIYLAACLVVSAAMIAACIATIRRVAVGQRTQREASSRARRRWRVGLLPTPSLDANPVLWREWSRSRPTRWGRVVGILHGLFALSLTAMAIYHIDQGGPISETAILANLYIVGVGLLLLSVRASTSLSEERMRGSLDVLLSTPMSTPSILAGKWWGTFRLAPSILLLPAAIGGLMCRRSGNWPSLAAYLLLLASYAALAASFGLAISVWIAQQGRAAGVCVGSYVAACVGWPFFSLMSGGGSSPAIMFVLGSPIAGAVVGTLRLRDDGLDIESLTWLLYMTLWAVIQGVASVFLFRAACETFDEGLGRIADRSERRARWRHLRALIPRFGRERDDAAETPISPA
ncbi:ABC transporter permease subunit [Paludisphaera mucosa]|uniref:ABC transporter permease subunit n=1 Tax=Paludisphaera mucosa TaxID=3030827 RepID=A0ABT6F5A7_9BACT|nr:ABC transporter permease subunit [Paludisphaera mucosa]MDG3002765.1 ABC transporter permease subunit [Paludisphaera mucosa]